MLKINVDSNGAQVVGSVELIELSDPNNIGSTKKIAISFSEEFLQDVKAYNLEDVVSNKIGEAFLKKLKG